MQDATIEDVGQRGGKLECFGKLDEGLGETRMRRFACFLAAQLGASPQDLGIAFDPAIAAAFERGVVERVLDGRWHRASHR